MTYSRDIHGGDMDLESCLGRHEVARSNMGDTEDRAEPQGHVTAGDRAPHEHVVTSPAPSERRVLDHLASPVLGESVSMYEREGERSEDMRLYENILDRVQRLLAAGDNKENMEAANVAQEENQNGGVKEVDQQAATWDRLRQLGVSFISPGDLGSASTGQDTLWLPQARVPDSQPRLHTPDASLAMNDLALKYLTDAELGQLAVVHQPKDKQKGELTDASITYFNQFLITGDGRGHIDFSLASHQFLAKYGHQQLHQQHQQHQQQQQIQPQPTTNRSEPRRTPSPYAPGQYQAIPEEPQQPRLQNPILNGPQFQRILDISAIRQQSKLL